MSDDSGDLFERQRRACGELLKRLSYEQREVTLASGRKSDFYIDCKQAVLTAEGHFLTGWLINRLLQDTGAGGGRPMGGLTMGADPIASAVSTMSYLAGRPLPAFYVRKEAKGHGTGQWLEGIKNLAARHAGGHRSRTSSPPGGSALKAIARAREFGLQVSR